MGLKESLQLYQVVKGERGVELESDRMDRLIAAVMKVARYRSSPL